MTAHPSGLLTVAEVAERLRISDAQVYKLADRQRDPLPLFDFGALRADQAELAEWITRQRRKRTK